MLTKLKLSILFVFFLLLTVNPVELIEQTLVVKLVDSNNNLLLTGSLRYYENGWKTATNNNNGTFSVTTTASAISLEMTYEYASQTISNVIVSTDTVSFQTKNVQVQLKNSLGNLMPAPMGDAGTVEYYAGQWRSFGTTVNGMVSKELLPKSYSFRMNYEYASNDKQQDISNDQPVVFTTKSVQVHLKNSLGNLIDQGTVEYYAGQWRSFGSTVNGIATKELLPKSYSFRMNYEYASNDKQQDINNDQPVVFTTVNAKVELKNSQNNFIDAGTVQYYSGQWRSFGNTSNGIVFKELLPKSYSFRMTYEYASIDKQQDITNNQTVVFNTTKVTLQLKNQAGILFDPGTGSYYSGAWRTIGVTSGGQIFKELLPKSYSFRMNYNNQNQQITQDVNSNPIVVFNYTQTLFPPVLTITQPQDSITTQLETVTIEGTVDNPGTTITINGEAVTLGINGTFSKNVALNIGTNSFTIIATAANSLTTTKYLTIFRESSIVLPPDPVTVAPPLDSTVITTMIKATEFLYTGSNPIQTGVDTGTIDPVRVAVIRGAVLNKNNQPLPGVTVTIHNQPEFGQTLSRLDGMYDMAVNGGGYLVLNFEKDGYFPIQRQVNTDWQDYTVVDSVVMIQLDPVVTTIDFSDTIEVARGSVVNDERGVRHATLFFEQGTTALMTMPNGSTQPLTNLNVRATEYTVGENGHLTMPAELPSMTAYTYCVELSVDEALQAGANSVIFSKPVKIYVDNFIDFPIGSVVPVGYYDKDEAKWFASKNGVVINILSEVDGKAQLDVNGDNVVEHIDSLTEWGFNEAELSKLAMEYNPGESLWRVEVEHFTPYDFNWSKVSGMPADGVPVLEDPEDDKKLDDDCKEFGNSTVGIQNQTLGESYFILGTPFNMQYESDRVEGRKDNYSMEIHISNDTLPRNLHHIKLMVTIAGKKMVRTFFPQPNLKYRIDWDGRDVYGRLLNGKQKALIEVGYFYKACYIARGWESVLRNYFDFGIIPSSSYTIICTAVEIDMPSAYQSWTELIGEEGGYVINQDIAGWSVDVHHSYDVNAKTLYLGDGTNRTSSIVNNQIKTFAGTGDYISAGDNGDAKLASFEYLNSLVKGKDGSIYVAENNRVRKIDKNGVITTIAGNGDYGVTGDGGLAINAAIGNISDIALSPAGDLFIAQVYEGVIRKVDRNGYITTIAGPGNYGDKGDYGDALLASLSPTKLTVDKDNSVFVLDQLHNCIRRIGTNNIITTFAGNGEYDFSGDGGQATEAALGLYMCFWHGPCINGDISVGPDGSLYIADMSNQRIRKVRNDGIINTIAGSGNLTDPNSGVQALDAYISAPTAIEIADDGTIYFSDSNSRLNKISTNGILTNIAGPCEDPFLLSPCPVSYEEGGIAGSSYIMPINITIGEDNTIYFADGSNKVLNIYPTLPSFNNNQIFLSSESGDEIFVFNEEGTHLKTLDRLTNKVLFEFEYNSAGKLVSIKDIDGLETSIQRDSSENPVSITSPFGQQTLLTTNSNGYLETVTNPANELTSFSYTDDGLLTNVTKPKGNPSTYTYDSRGRLIRDENSGGGFIELNRTELTNGYRVTKNTAEGRETVYQVEFLPSGELKTTNTSEGNLTSSSIQNPDGTTTVTKSDGMRSISVLGPDPQFGMEAPLTKSLIVKSPSGLTSTFKQTKTITQYTGDEITGIVDSFITNNRVTRSIYDGNQNLFTSISPMGKQAFTYTDTLGRVMQSSIPGINPVNYVYNNLGFLTSIEQNGRQTSFTYNSKGYLESVTDPLGRTETTFYDSVGRVLTQILPNNQQILYSYDANGNLVSITPPGKPAHTFTYTDVDLNDNYTPPFVSDSAGATNYIYNLDKELVRTILPDNSIIDIEYDTTNCNCSKSSKPSKILFDRGTISFAYDSTTGNLVSVASPDSIITSFTYDGSLPTSISQNGIINGTIGVTYNNNFQVTSQTINGTNPINFIYDDDGLLTNAGSLSLAHNAQNGLLTGTTLGNTTSNYTYNTNGEVTGNGVKFNSTDIYNSSYTLDSLGRIKGITETIGGATNDYEYIYNSIGYLVETKNNGLTTAKYEFDANGNRVKYTTVGDTITASYDNQDRLLVYGSVNYIYGKNGELQQKINGSDTTLYDYDNLGDLINVRLPNGSLIEYIIDGQNHRVAKKLNGNIVKKWLYAGGLTPIAELDSVDNVIKRFAAGYIIKNDTTYRVITDHLGSVRMIVNTSSGEVVQKIDYDEYGNITNVLSQNDFLDFTYAGGLYDSDTKLIRFGARDYDAETGRWTCKDPIGFGGGVSNLYEYVVNDPINSIDPEGLQQLGLLIGPIPSIFSSRELTIAGFTILGGSLGALLGGGSGLSAGPGALALSPALSLEGAAIGSGIGLGVGVFLADMMGMDNSKDPCNKGTQTPSKTLWEGKEGRLDVENPNPGQRPGQIHFQDRFGNKYIYDPKSNSFRDAPRKINELLNNSSFFNKIKTGLRYLGM